MTKKLYEQDSYLYSFSAKAEQLLPVDGGFAVVLDRTAFFPEGGGQSADAGTINGIEVTDVQEIEGEILHYFKSAPPFRVGDTVTGEVDGETRFARMQAHTGEHLVSGVAHNLFGVENVGFHMDGVRMTVDFDRYLEPRQLDEVERQANRYVWQDLPVTTALRSEEGENAAPYRSKLDDLENPRIVTIAGVDRCACCAPHLSSTGQIGLIRILSGVRHRGGVRLTLICGREAYEDAVMRSAQVTAICEALALRPHEAADAVAQLIEKDKAGRRALNEEKERLLRFIAEGVAPTAGHCVRFLPDFSSEELRKLAAMCMERCGGIFAALSGDDAAGYRFAMASRSFDLTAWLPTFRTALLAGGGGNADMIQGKLRVKRSAVEEFFDELQQP